MRHRNEAAPPAWLFSPDTRPYVQQACRPILLVAPQQDENGKLCGVRDGSGSSSETLAPAKGGGFEEPTGPQAAPLVVIRMQTGIWNLGHQLGPKSSCSKQKQRTCERVGDDFNWRLWGVRRATSNKRRATSKKQQAASDEQRVTSSNRRAASDEQRSQKQYQYQCSLPSWGLLEFRPVTLRRLIPSPP
ncbi:uncharacterized protein UV8b_01040 [Ustilaginoidea virens]|uniref:Uncharacterized protein n=1 Tax=Ustilaginoidea virens TaxID=1159556 RepID=A0A8E5HKS6_USTVR|nr:uncharacterized protein UV8b_01040 [Ustilaginoidea virens]QUC16799.1 hypothetical protein UV8b_01040 [Ustilaginoidea virens]